MTATTIMIVTPHGVMSRRSRVALAPVYGGLPVRLYSHLATAVHQVAGDPGMVHHLVHTSIRLHCTGLSLAADTATILFCD